jgi:hypothetical protein
MIVSRTSEYEINCNFDLSLNKFKGIQTFKMTALSRVECHLFTVLLSVILQNIIILNVMVPIKTSRKAEFYPETSRLSCLCGKF